MLPFVTEDYEIIKACSIFINIALIRINKIGNITDINNHTGTLFNTTHDNTIGMSLANFCAQYQLATPQNNHTVQYRHNHFESITLRWRIHDLDDSQIITAEVLNSVFHSAFSYNQVLDMLNKPPIALYCKDLCGTYIEANDYCNYIAFGQSSDYSIIGSNDNDLVWANTATILQEHDKHVYQGKTYRFEETIILANGTQVCMQSVKFPLLNESNHVIGIMGISINTSLLKPNQNQPKNSQFSTREQECLKLLANGHSVREIGELLSISKRTAEAHINRIKIKTKTFKLFQTGFVIGQDQELDL